MPDRFRDISLFCKDFQQLNKEQQLEAQVRKWQYEARYWQSRFDAAKERQSELEAENAQLKAKLKLREKQLFERKSEKAKASSSEQSGSEDKQPWKTLADNKKEKLVRIVVGVIIAICPLKKSTTMPMKGSNAVRNADKSIP